MRKKIGELKPSLGLKAYLLVGLSFIVWGYFLDVAMPIIKSYVFQLHYQLFIKNIIYYFCVGLFAEFSMAIAVFIVIKLWFMLKGKV